MIVSKNWLQKYFKESLPESAKISDAFTFGAFEVEGVEENGGDTAFDLKVLPDRACYALSHRGIAYELSAILGLKMEMPEAVKEKIENDEKISVSIDENKLCLRYSARGIKNVKVAASPLWLKESLEAVGQRSINVVVDATNYVMLDCGQPLHAFDADTVKGAIVVRSAKIGEKIELLPEKGGSASRIVELNEQDLVIADDEGAIAIAGVKGGLRTAVTENTKNLIIESANFDASAVRKTSTRLGLRNDASKRFENRLSVELAQQAIEEVSVLLKKLCPDARVGEITDSGVRTFPPTTFPVTLERISARLGIDIKADQLEEILGRLRIGYEKRDGAYVLTIPDFRLDLTMQDDIVEEVGRIYGYDKIPPKTPQKVDDAGPVNHVAYWTEKLKDVLFGLGYSEVQTSSFALDGEVEIHNPLASDKKFLRKMLYENMRSVLTQNAKNAALLGLDEIRVFEIGTVFTKEGEQTRLALGLEVVKSIKKKDEYIKQVIDNTFDEISKAIGLTIKITKPLGQKDPIVEIIWSDFLPKLKAPAKWDIKKLAGTTKYAPFSPYPYMVRDVAVFVPSSVSEKDVADVIDSKSGPLKVRSDLFDVFSKKFDNGEEKTSYAFRIVFQSHERTLKEEEINEVMKNVSDAMTAKSWQVR